MGKKTDEEVRKDLNKKVIKRTFFSEIKEKKNRPFTAIVTFIAVLAGLLGGDWLIGVLGVTGVVAECLIKAGLIFVIEILGFYIL